MIIQTTQTSKNFEGCNHHLSKKAVEDADEMLNLYGNAPFDWRAEGWNERIVNELLSQDFLKHYSSPDPDSPSRVFRNRIIFGKGR